MPQDNSFFSGPKSTIGSWRVTNKAGTNEFFIKANDWQIFWPVVSIISSKLYCWGWKSKRNRRLRSAEYFDSVQFVRGIKYSSLHQRHAYRIGWSRTFYQMRKPLIFYGLMCELIILNIKKGTTREKICNFDILKRFLKFLMLYFNAEIQRWNIKNENMNYEKII